MNNNHLYQYILQIADNALVLGHRLSELTGHGPILEQDIAITNISLDLIGQARNLFQYAAQVDGSGKTEDDIAFVRNEREYLNVLLVEQPNGDFGQTIVRQFLFDVFNFYFYRALQDSTDETLAAIANKSLKEVTYHLRYSSEWMLRLGDGTEVSHGKMQTALDQLWMYTGELTTMNELEQEMLQQKIGVDLMAIQPLYLEKVKEVVQNATLTLPETAWMQKGGKEGKHSEHLGFLLAEMQYLQRAYPGQEW